MTTHVECERCNGKGHINGFAHVMDGVCFKCDGTGKVNARQPRKLSAKQLAAQAAKEAQREANANKFNEECNQAYALYQNHPYVLRVAENYKKAAARDVMLRAQKGWETK